MTPVAKRLWHYFLPYWRQWLAAMLMLVIVAASETALAMLLQPLTNGFLEENPQDNIFIAWLPLWLLLLFVPRSLANFYASIGLFWVSQQAVAHLRQALFQHFTRLPSVFFAEQSSGTLISRFSYDLEQISANTRQALATVVRDSFMALGLLLWLLWLSWLLTLALLFLVPLALFFLGKLQKRLLTLSEAVQTSQGALGERLLAVINGEKIIKVHESQNLEQQIFAGVHEKFLQQQQRRAKFEALILPLLEFFSIAVLILFLWVIGRDFANNPLHLDVGSVVSYVTALILLFPPLKRLAKVQGSLQTAYAAAAHVFSVLDLPTEPAAERTQTNATKQQETLVCIKDETSTGLDVTVEKIYFRYKKTATEERSEKNEKWLLENINLHLSPGQSLALVGGSGSGKSTLLALLARFYQAQRGEIFFNQRPSQSCSLHAWRAQLAYVSQDSVIFPGTLAENIAYGRTLDAAAIRRAAELAYVHEFADAFPAGLNTLVGTSGLKLSGGQKQRLALARALAKASPLLLLDEPTSALDNQLEALVMANLLHLGKTVILAAHRLASLPNVDHIVVLADGKIVEQGTHTALLAACGRYRALWEMQAGAGFSSDS
jgi:subfamily B ATP-binding cassette protein MsbA